MPQITLLTARSLCFSLPFPLLHRPYLSHSSRRVCLPFFPSPSSALPFGPNLLKFQPQTIPTRPDRLGLTGSTPATQPNPASLFFHPPICNLPPKPCTFHVPQTLPVNPPDHFIPHPPPDPFDNSTLVFPLVTSSSSSSYPIPPPRPSSTLILQLDSSPTPRSPSLHHALRSHTSNEC